MSSIAGELRDFNHIIIHGSRNWTEDTEKVKKRFPDGVLFIEWKYAERDINALRDFKALCELIKILKAYSPQKLKGERVIVHLHSSKAGFLGRLACRLVGIKAVIYTPHCGAFLRKDIGSLKRKIYRSLEWLGGCFGGRVVGCGPSEGEIYKNLGINTTYVSNGVVIKPLDTKPENSSLISFTGIASFQKDPALWNEVACRCAAYAGEKGFSFCWIGDGPEAVKINTDHAVLTGWKTAPEVEDLLLKTAVYFSASAWEGLPYGVLEAMSSGCALLLRNVPGNRELVQPGENGWLFDTAAEAENHLREMLKDKALLAIMGKKSREIAEENYSLKQMGEGYRRIYTGFSRGIE